MDLTKSLKPSKYLDPITPALRQQYQHWGRRRPPNPELQTHDPTEESSSALRTGCPDPIANTKPTAIPNHNQSPAPPPPPPSSLPASIEVDNNAPPNDPTSTTLQAQIAALSALTAALECNCLHLQREVIAGLMRSDTRYAARHATAAAGALNQLDVVRQQLDGLEGRLRCAEDTCGCAYGV